MNDSKHTGEKRMQPVVLVVIKEHGKLLLTRRAEENPEDAHFNNIWQIPGGGLEFAETPEECAMREAREELGIEIEIVSLIPAIYTLVRGNWQGILVPYMCKKRFEQQEKTSLWSFQIGTILRGKIVRSFMTRVLT